MLDEAPESTRQLCKFLLNTSKVRRKGGVCDFDLPPIKSISVGSILFKEALVGIPISWAAYEITTIGSGARYCFKFFQK